MKTTNTFLKIFKDIKQNGKLVAPRGELVLELENYSYELQPYERFTSFVSRKLNVDYIKREFLWYLNGDRHDTSIVEYATLWKSIMNADGSFNSNYGQYFFGNEKQFMTVANILRHDKDSRRASILLLTKDHVNSTTLDVPCTYALNFRIRNNKLNMSVHMRSQDAIYGMGNDAPAFSFLHEMMLHELSNFYPGLEYGIYHHSVDSFHVYQKHFKLLDAILTSSYADVRCPQISGFEEVRYLLKNDFSTIPKRFAFTAWLHS